MDTLGLIGTILSVSLPITSSVPLALFVDSRRGKGPRLRVITMIRSGCQVLDDFYIHLERHSKHAVLPTAVLIALWILLALYTDCASSILYILTREITMVERFN